MLRRGREALLRAKVVVTAVGHLRPGRLWRLLLLLLMESLGRAGGKLLRHVLVL